MDAAVAGGLFGVAGVFLGAGLSELSARRGRREARKERRALELIRHDAAIAEKLDYLLTEALKAIGDAPKHQLESVYTDLHAQWQESWGDILAAAPRARPARTLQGCGGNPECPRGLQPPPAHRRRRHALDRQPSSRQCARRVELLHPAGKLASFGLPRLRHAEAASRHRRRPKRSLRPPQGVARRPPHAGLSSTC